MIGTVLSTLPSSPSLPVEEVRKVEQVDPILFYDWNAYRFRS